MTFPTVTNPDYCRTMHAACWSMMTTLKRQRNVKNAQLRKLTLTALAANWKRSTLGAVDAHHAILAAAKSLEKADLETAYRAMGAFIGATFKPEAACRQS